MILVIALASMQQAPGVKPKADRTAVKSSVPASVTISDSVICTKSKKCPDSCKRKNKMIRKNGKDVFIDKDGDGINDHRCNGIGLGKGKPKAKQSKKKANK